MLPAVGESLLAQIGCLTVGSTEFTAWRMASLSLAASIFEVGLGAGCPGGCRSLAAPAWRVSEAMPPPWLQSAHTLKVGVLQNALLQYIVWQADHQLLIPPCSRTNMSNLPAVTGPSARSSAAGHPAALHFEVFSQPLTRAKQSALLHGPHLPPSQQPLFKALLLQHLPMSVSWMSCQQCAPAAAEELACQWSIDCPTQSCRYVHYLNPSKHVRHPSGPTHAQHKAPLD